MIESGRKKIEDKIFSESISNEEYHNHLFIRIGSKKKTFENIDFSHTYFEHCYFKNCFFNSCNFTGCKFTNSNFSGSSFSGCKFEYAQFDKTLVDDDILDNCPGYDNLKLKFARMLRINFQSLGNADAANKAIQIELKATEIHLKKEWTSNEAYYNKKYQNIKRVSSFFEWSFFILFQFIWGNGESLVKLLRMGFIIWCVMALIDSLYFRDFININTFWDSLCSSFWRMPEIFFNIENPQEYSKLYLSAIVALRLVGFGLFMSILIKRFNKR